MFELIYYGAFIGLGATLAMDVWAFIQSRVWGIAFPNWALPGRWFAHLFKAKVFHKDIKLADEVPYELALGWLFHYGVGVAYGFLFLLLVGVDWLIEPHLLSAWLFSIATIAAGWFILQPGMGLGWAASRTPTPWKARGLGLIAHTAFGIGMWASGMSV